MIPFRELQNLCDELRDKTGVYCSVTVRHNSYADSSELEYGVYTETHSHQYFKTVSGLKSAIKNILDPKPDVGVTLSERKEQEYDAN